MLAAGRPAGGDVAGRRAAPRVCSAPSDVCDSSVAAAGSAPSQTPGLVGATPPPRRLPGAQAAAAPPLNAGVLAATVAGGGLVGLLTVLASRRRRAR